MICPWCDHDNPPGLDLCGNCLQDLTQLDRPIAQDRVEKSLMDDPVSVLQPRMPITISPDTSLSHAVNILLEYDIGAVLVVDRQGSLLGILSERDFLLKHDSASLFEENRSVAEFMTRRPETIQQTDSLAFALHKMDCGGYRHLPVMHEGLLIGMISVRDLLNHVDRICANISANGGLRSR